MRIDEISIRILPTFLRQQTNGTKSHIEDDHTEKCFHFENFDFTAVPNIRMMWRRVIRSRVLRVFFLVLFVNAANSSNVKSLHSV